MDNLRTSLSLIWKSNQEQNIQSPYARIFLKGVCHILILLNTLSCNTWHGHSFQKNTHTHISCHPTNCCNETIILPISDGSSSRLCMVQQCTSVAMDFSNHQRHKVWSLSGCREINTVPYGWSRGFRCRGLSPSYCIHCWERPWSRPNFWGKLRFRPNFGMDPKGSESSLHYEELQPVDLKIVLSLAPRSF